MWRKKRQETETDAERVPRCGSCTNRELFRQHTAGRYLLVDVSTITPLVDLLVGDVSGCGSEPPKPSP